MKYEILHRLRDSLNEKYKHRTAKQYYQAVKNLLEDQQFNSVEEIDSERLERKLRALKTRNDIYAAKQGLLALSELHPGTPVHHIDFKELTHKKRNIKKRSFEPVSLDTIKRRINSIPEATQRIAFRLALVSGLRIAELSALVPEDIRIEENNQITVQVRDGKGGKDRTVECLPDPYTARQLGKLMEEAEDGKRLFPSSHTLQVVGIERNFECHDLRRAFAKCYIREKNKTHPPDEAYKLTMDAMGHTDWRTTRKYLRRQIGI